MTPTHVLFDFDGTLVDSAPAILESYAEALAVEGRAPAVPLDRSLIGPPLGTTLARLAGSDDPGLITRLSAAFRHVYDTDGVRRTQAFAGIDSLLDALHAADIALHIVTNKRIAPTLAILTALGWHERFAGVHALDVAHPPFASKVDLLRHVLAAQAIDAAAAQFVGDSLDDALAASRNAVPFVAVGWGYGTAPAWAAEHGAPCATTPAALGRLLGVDPAAGGPSGSP